MCIMSYKCPTCVTGMMKFKRHENKDYWECTNPECECLQTWEYMNGWSDAIVAMKREITDLWENKSK